MSQKLLSSREDIAALLKRHGARHVLVVCDPFIMGQPLQQYLTQLPCDFSYFTAFKPNPLYEDALAGARLFDDIQGDLLIAIGGGSAIDTAKAIKMFCRMDLDGDCLSQPFVDGGVPLLAIPSTAGTGSEATRYAVIYRQGVKQSLTDDRLIPDYVLLEPTLLASLPDYQRKATLLDAFCQAIESYWSVNATAASQELARQAIVIIMANAHDYLDRKEATYGAALQASHLAGQAINITQTTAAHAMSYKITSLFHAAHGHAVAMCLPYLWQYMKDHLELCRDARGRDYLAATLAKLDAIMGGDGLRFFTAFYAVLDMPVIQADNAQIDVLAAAVNQQRLANFPVTLDTAAITALYRQILHYYDVPCPDGRTRQLQLIELDILRQADALCRRHGLRYYLAEGTLLGALRHHGFIPWDDDMDIMMPRADYDRFLALAPAELGADYQLQSPANVACWWLGNAKIRYLGDCGFRQDYLQGVMANGPFIDVFPLDACHGPADSRTARQVRLFHRWHAMLLRKAGTNKNSTMRKKVVRLMSLFHSRKWLQARMTQAQTMYRDDPDAAFLWSSCSLYPYQREIFTRDMLEPTRTARFEDMECPIPAQAEAMLTQIYHDYLRMPDADKRVNKHPWDKRED